MPGRVDSELLQGIRQVSAALTHDELVTFVQQLGDALEGGINPGILLQGENSSLKQNLALDTAIHHQDGGRVAASVTQESTVGPPAFETPLCHVNRGGSADRNACILDIPGCRQPMAPRRQRLWARFCAIKQAAAIAGSHTGMLCAVEDLMDLSNDLAQLPEDSRSAEAEQRGRGPDDTAEPEAGGEEEVVSRGESGGGGSLEGSAQAAEGSAGAAVAVQTACKEAVEQQAAGGDATAGVEEREQAPAVRDAACQTVADQSVQCELLQAEEPQPVQGRAAEHPDAACGGALQPYRQPSCAQSEAGDAASSDGVQARAAAAAAAAATALPQLLAAFAAAVQAPAGAAAEELRAERRSTALCASRQGSPRRRGCPSCQPVLGETERESPASGDAAIQPCAAAAAENQVQPPTCRRCARTAAPAAPQQAESVCCSSRCRGGCDISAPAANTSLPPPASLPPHPAHPNAQDAAVTEAVAARSSPPPAYSAAAVGGVPGPPPLLPHLHGWKSLEVAVNNGLWQLRPSSVEAPPRPCQVVGPGQGRTPYPTATCRRCSGTSCHPPVPQKPLPPYSTLRYRTMPPGRCRSWHCSGPNLCTAAAADLCAPDGSWLPAHHSASAWPWRSASPCTAPARGGCHGELDLSDLDDRALQQLLSDGADLGGAWSYH